MAFKKATITKEPGGEEGFDFTLDFGDVFTVWITVGDLSLAIRNWDDGLNVEAYPYHNEAEADPIDDLYVSYQELAEPEA